MTSVPETKQFSVVEFLADDSVEVVPSVWLTDNNECRWPDHPPKRFKSLVSNPTSVPTPTWPIYNVRIVTRCDSYEKAVKKASKFIKTDKTDTTDAESATSRRPKRIQVQVPCPPSSSLHTPTAVALEKDGSKQNETNNNLTADTPGQPLELDWTFHTQEHSKESQSLPSVSLPSLGCVNVDVFGNGDQDEPQTLSQNPVPIQVVTGIASTDDINQLRQELEVFQEIVLKKLEEARHEFADVKKLLLKLLAQPGICEAKTKPQAASLSLLPVKSLEDFRTLNGTLENTDNYVELVNFLARIGGDTVSKNVYNVLSTIFKTSIANEVGLTSNSGKTAVKDTLVGKAVREAVHRSPRPTPTTDEIINKDIGRWLRSKAYKPKNEAEGSNTAQNQEKANTTIRPESVESNSSDEQ